MQNMDNSAAGPSYALPPRQPPEQEAPPPEDTTGGTGWTIKDGELVDGSSPLGSFSLLQGTEEVKVANAHERINLSLPLLRAPSRPI